MPINESSGKPRRERFPLRYDIEGVPRDNAYREQLLEQEKLQEEIEETMKTQNSFTVDKPVAITDINNPPHKNYNPHDPKNQFPRMVYHHDNGRILTVANAKEQQAALKRGYSLEPSPKHDYSKVSRAGFAEIAKVGEKREEEMSAEELARLDDEEAAAAAAAEEGGGEETEEVAAAGGRRRRG